MVAKLQIGTILNQFSLSGRKRAATDLLLQTVFFHKVRYSYVKKTNRAI